MKEQFTVYLEPDLMRALTEYAERRCKPKSLVAEAAIAAFLSPDAAERQEAALARRLDRINRQLERLERDVGKNGWAERKASGNTSHLRCRQ
jgi:predicted transcriptional regulator